MHVRLRLIASLVSKKMEYLLTQTRLRTVQLDSFHEKVVRKLVVNNLIRISMEKPPYVRLDLKVIKMVEIGIY